MKLLNASTEFVVAKHHIGWVDPDFTNAFSGVSFTNSTILPKIVTLPKDMTGHELQEKYPHLCTLGDVLLYMEKKKDWCTFLVQGRREVVVVCVDWDSGYQRWGVWTWNLGSGWNAGCRFSSRTTDSSDPLSLGSLEQRVEKLEETMKKMTEVIKI